ncbi:hypothetical protein PVAND_012401 [Polypedilum vanderplanki]|uniref:Uncharacterized protein n=1 Tax=Polypedilum vanderplanki TaxID=319348 RepID=A0A9J6CLF6_POLVA|nr:hypothetical protein PVAND_012401 [Polypedilum vanderplanki]
MSDDKSTPNFSALTENLSQQQAKISALKELVRQSEHGKNTASAQEKVKNIAQRLSNLKSKATKSKMHRASSEVSEDYSITHYEEEENEIAAASSSNIPSTSSSSRTTRSETPGSEKITLLRKQMELNRMKMAERENKSKEIEQMVTQLKSRFETSQMSLEKSVELGRSMGDLSSPIPSMLLHSQNRSVSDVSHNTSQPLNFENERIKFLEKRIRELESTLSDKENLSETEALQQLERKIIDLEETIKEKDSVIEARTKAVALLTENLSKKKKNVVDSLEDTKQEMFKMQETFIETELAYRKDKDRLQKLLDEKTAEITNLNEKNEILEKSRYELTIENSDIKTKLEEVQDYSTKISELNKLNESLQKRISTLESQRYEFITEDEVGEAKSAEGQIDLTQKIKELEELLKSRDEEIEKLQESLQEKTVEVNVVNANISVLQDKYNALCQKPLFTADSSTDEETQAEIAKLKQQLDDSNKSMIKTKLKMKQMQKQIDTLQKSSDGSQEISRLNEEIQILNQKIAELEEEKGSYQLQLVGNENQSDLEHKLKVLETTCQNQNSAIQLLEEQKAEMNEELQKVKDDLSRVTELEARISELESLNNEQEHKIHQISEEKEALSAQMNQYLNENMELLDKLEKISKGSSAESIEMVANLTAQEKLEIEEYQKGVEIKEEEVPIEISQELNESLRSLRMESSELMEKIELFTIERREVLEKLDALTVENHVLTGNYEKLQEEKSELEKKLAILMTEKEDFEATVLNLNTEKSELSQKLAELSEHRTKLQEEINKLVKNELGSSSPHSSPLKSTESSESDQSSSSPKELTTSIDREACEKLLKQLDSEIQNLNKNKDKNQKIENFQKVV